MRLTFRGTILGLFGHGSRRFLSNILRKRGDIRRPTLYAFPIMLLLSQSCFAFEKECRIVGTTEQSKEILTEKYPHKVSGHIKGGRIVYIGGDFGGQSEIFKLTNEGFAQLGMIKNTDIDCGPIGQSDGYPIVFDNSEQLSRASGLYFDSDEKESNQVKNLYSCLYIGDGSPSIKLSKTFTDRYEKKKISLDNVCTVLESGQVRFDPMTGAHLPTYVIKDSGRGEEYTLIVPDCFAQGRFSRRLNDADIQPIGCQIRYHPFSGRKLNNIESKIITKFTKIAIDGDAGEVKDDSSSLLASSARKGSSINVDMLRQMLK